MYAILRAGGKQVKVSPGDVIRVEKPSEKVEKGQKLSLTDLVFAGGGDESGVDPKGISVVATVLGEVRTRKVLVFKKKRTKQFRRTKGHRQTVIELRIDAHAYDGGADTLLNYMREQRSGWNQVIGDSVHTHDGIVVDDTGHAVKNVSVSGGWTDAISRAASPVAASSTS